MSYNKFICIANLTKDPEALRYTPSGTAVCSFNIAVNSGYGDKKEVLFIGVTVFGKSAEACSKYLTKGSQCLVEGRLQEQKWEKDGDKKSRMVIIANDVKFLGSKGQGKASDEEAPHDEHDSMAGEPF